MSEWVAGRIPVLECLRAAKRRPHKLYLLEDAKNVEQIVRAANEIPIQKCTRHELNRMLPDALHQGVILEADPLSIWDLRDWLLRPRSQQAILVALDEITDPHNFGAIARSAAACGAEAVLYCQRHAAPVTPVGLKSAAGAMEYIDLVSVPNMMRALKTLKNAGFWIIALDAAANKTLWDADLTGKITLVVGSEGKGIRPLVRHACDDAVRIPIAGPITSLNASVSAGIALAECLRQRLIHK